LCGRHVRPFGHDVHAVLDQVLGVLGVDLVLRGAGEGAVGLDVPERIVVQVGRQRRVSDSLELSAYS
jgi:hypothetical protein